MIKVFIAPRRYVQGVGVLKDIGKYVAPLGKRVLVAWGPVVGELFADTVEASFKENDLELIPFQFSGECDRGQIGLGIEAAKAGNAQVVVGLGGGKAIDLAKAVAMAIDAKLVTAPTIASNDAPTSAATVYYTEDGIMDGWDIWPRNPDLVLVDSQVIVNASARWLVSGIGDGLATWFEAEAAYKKRAVALAGGVATQAALTLAELCYDTLMEYGVDAVRDCAQHIVTPAVERVIEANTLLSGLGFESAGVASAHAIGNGLTGFDECAPFSHGEKVAFGLATQLCLDEDIEPDERLDVFDFMVAVGLPVTLAELGLADVTEEQLMGFAEAMCGPGQITHNHVFTVTTFDLYSAMVAADQLGQERLALAGK
jgi:glycerol dehydrogenase